MFLKYKEQEGLHDEPGFCTTAAYKMFLWPKGSSLPMKLIEEILKSYSIIEAEVKWADKKSRLCIDYLLRKPLYAMHATSKTAKP